MLHRVYLSPGMFGFGRLASYDYFAHVIDALGARFRARGVEVIAVTAHNRDDLPLALAERLAR